MKPIIEYITDEIKLKYDADNMIYQAVQNVGINVDKERLVEALRNSRCFYEEGYEDAKRKYEKKWIPCSWRMPNKNDWYYVTARYKGTYTTDKCFWDGTEWLMYDLKSVKEFDNEIEIIAWIPLPKPYEE